VRAGKVGDAPVAPRQMRQDLPARWISQRGKSSVQRFRRIFNHLVNYLAESPQRANIFLLRFGIQRQPRLPAVKAIDYQAG
jgi:hypothetical protein